MEIDWIRRPSEASAVGGNSEVGTLNLCFNALDRHVVHGLADELALRVDRVTGGRVERTFAQLLEDVAAFGGVLRAFGVGVGDRVLSRLPTGHPGLVVALAASRVGAVHVLVEPYDDPVGPLVAHRPALVVAEGTDLAMAEALASAMATGTGGGPAPAAVWRGELPEGQELGWDVVLRAGRTDPAAVVEVAVTAEAFAAGDRTLTLAQVLDGDDDLCGAWPLDVIGTLLEGGLVALSLP